MTLAWRAMNGGMAALFAVGALVQLNDPDPVRWLLLYLAASAASLLVVLRQRAGLVAAPTAMIGLVWAVVLGASMTTMAPLSSLFDEFEMKSVVIEETREVLGLGIITLWMVVIGIVSRRDQAFGSADLTARSSM